MMIQSAYHMKSLRATAEFVIFFVLGAGTTIFLLTSIFAFVFSLQYKNRVFPGVKVVGTNISGLSPNKVTELLNKNYSAKSRWIFHYQDQVYEETDETLGLKIPIDRITKRAYAIGRSDNLIHSFLQIWDAYFDNMDLPLDTDWDPGAHERFLAKLHTDINYAPIEAQFRFQANSGPDLKGRVVAFVQSKEGQTLDEGLLERDVIENFVQHTLTKSVDPIDITIYTKSLPPNTTSEKANTFGIVEKIGQGESYFYDSIPGRVYNIGLGTEKVSGSLVAPGETFSFDNAIGTVSAVFGFQKAYAIIQGKTVLDDGGGVCQVSTTLYRAVLNAGLPVVERVGHAYRVGFYEQGGFLPGLDATVYPPSPDFKFKNDTGNWILLQGDFDKSKSKLTFEIFGKSDGRKSDVNKPVILSTTPPPDPIYEDDPAAPAGQIRQIDTAHAGANVYFTRKVTRDDEVLIDEKIFTNYIPWPARYLRGTKS